MKNAIVKFLSDEEGLTIVEYAVAGALITLAVVGAFVLLGSSVATAISGLDSAVNAGGGGGGGGDGGGSGS